MPTSYSLTSLLDGIANRQKELLRRWYPEDAELERSLEERLRCLKRDYPAHGQSDHPTELSLSSTEALQSKSQRLKSLEEDYLQLDRQKWVHSRTVYKVQGTISFYALNEALSTAREVRDLRRQGIRFPAYIAPALKMAAGRAAFYVPCFYLVASVLNNTLLPECPDVRSFKEDLTYDLVPYRRIRSPEQLRKDLLAFTVVPWISAAALLAFVH